VKKFNLFLYWSEVQIDETVVLTPIDKSGLSRASESIAVARLTVRSGGLTASRLSRQCDASYYVSESPLPI
jgi:hypothetical protein